MKKKEYLEKLDSLGFDRSRYCIISGGVMMMHNLREETEDIDIKVPEEYYDELKQSITLIPSPKMANLYEYGTDVEIKVGGFDKSNIEIIDGYPVESLECQLKWKLENNRPKDEKDIKLIREYLESRK